MRGRYFQTSEALVLVNKLNEKLYLEDGYRRAVVGISGMGMVPGQFITTRTFRQPQVVESMVLEPRRIVLDLGWYAPTREAYLASRRELSSFVQPTADNEIILRRVYPDGSMRDIQCYTEASPTFIGERDGNPTLLRDQLTLIAHNPLFYNPIQQSLTLADTATGGFGFPYGFPYGYPPVGFAEGTIEYGGDAREYPTIMISGPVTDLVLTHVERSAQISISGTIGNRKSVTISLEPGNIAVTRSDGVNLIGNIGRSNLQDFVLDPSTTNTIIAEGTSTGGGTTVTVTYYERYTTA